MTAQRTTAHATTREMAGPSALLGAALLGCLLLSSTYIPAAPTPTPAPTSTSPIAGYPWTTLPTMPPYVDTLETRLAPPAGYVRVPLVSKTFGAFLRTLPLAPVGTPVRSFRGDVILPATDSNLAAVVAIDVGSEDLQQCADSIVRMHGEWMFGIGRGDEVSYRAAAGFMMPYKQYAGGFRVHSDGAKANWVARSKSEPVTHYPQFRRYEDMVFAWANTGSLAVQGKAIGVADMRPGDFFVLPGSPGHAVLILDMAVHPNGKKVALLGQGFMPAQSFHVLRSGAPTAASVWYALDAGTAGVKTPFWPTFPWSSLRRLDT